MKCGYSYCMEEISSVIKTNKSTFALLLLRGILKPDVLISQMSLLIFNYNFKKNTHFSIYLTTLTIYNTEIMLRCVLFVILNHLWILNLISYFNFHVLYCRHVWGDSKKWRSKRTSCCHFLGSLVLVLGFC